MTERTKKLLPFVLAALAAVGGLFAAAEEPKQTKNKTFSERLKESSAAHFWIAARKYDEALKTLPYVDDVDAVEPVTGSTALTLAAADETADAYDMVQALILKFGASPTVTDRNGFTALHFAASVGNLPVVEFLIEQGADVNALPEIRGCGENCPPITPLYMAFQKGHTRVVEFLESRGADRIDAKTREDLEIQAKVREAIAKFGKERAPRGVDKAQWKRLRFNSIFDEAGETLRSAGRVAEAAQLDRMRGPLLEAMENTPRNPGVSIADWYREMMQKAVASMAANQQ